MMRILTRLVIATTMLTSSPCGAQTADDYESVDAVTLFLAAARPCDFDKDQTSLREWMELNIPGYGSPPVTRAIIEMTKFYDEDINATAYGDVMAFCASMRPVYLSLNWIIR